MFDTTLVAGSDDTFDCLILTEEYYDVLEPIWLRVPRTDIMTAHRYCRRSNLFDIQQMSSVEKLTDSNHKAFSFDQLRSMNITYDQLYDWHAPIDIIEDYVSGKSIGLFVNCSEDTLWFGSTCEYTFDSTEDLTILLYERFGAKKDHLPSDLNVFTNGTCYEMIDGICGSILCLDWREICDGKIDCKTGLDERYCQQLEMNECNSITEQRCYDGQCIDNTQDLWYNKDDCSKLSESDIEAPHICYRSFKEECENAKCSPLQFSCGDGYCYDGPSNGKKSCWTQRDKNYLEKMSSSSLILFSHVHLIFNDTQPELICYNETLCPYLSRENLIMSTNTHDGLPCHALERFSNKIYTSFDEMVIDVKRLVSSCSQLPLNHDHPNDSCPMYQCDDGSKCLSFHRLIDNIEDCTNGDDERTTHVCSPNVHDRFICDNGTKCISQRLIDDDVENCNDKTDESIIQAALLQCSNPFSRKCPFYNGLISVYRLDFAHICNGIVEYIADENNNTDESDCLTIEWPCDMYLSRCDQLWNCPDGHDELGCNVTTVASIYCNNTEHFCLDIISGDRKCLAMVNVNDNFTDCIGSFDEREFCRNQYPYDYAYRYKCQNSTKCISYMALCDCKTDCPEEDDEKSACAWLYNGNEPSFSCNQYWGLSCAIYRDEGYDGRDDLFCSFSDIRREQVWRWNQGEAPLFMKQEHFEERSSDHDNLAVIWSCNRGLYARSTKDSSGFVCFCPEYYYGDRCQYQRKRIKVRLEINMQTSFNFPTSAFKFVVLLVHNNKTSTTIVSHDQFIYVPLYRCLPKFYIILLYPLKDPYRLLTNHSIHIHVFDIDTLEHRYSRNYPLSFEFLPVQTIFKRILIPETRINAESKQISLSYTGCSSCSNTSECLGHDVSLDRDICVCSRDYAGRQCLIPLNLCTNNTCNNDHGTCQPLNTNRDLLSPAQCLCNLGWYGTRCEYSAPRVYVSFAQDVTFLSSNMVFLHLVDAFNRETNSDHLGYSDYSDYLHFIKFHRFSKETLNLSFTFNGFETLLNGGFIQFYEHQYKFEYYFLFLFKLDEEPRSEFSVKVESSHRCYPVNELFDDNILAQPDIRRVKNYQRPCRQRQHLQNKFLCFYDDYLMCICREDDHAYCFYFQANLDTCDKKECNGRGMCVQDNEKCPYNSQCICEPCAYGTFCQFSTAGYTLSLDGIIGSHILSTATSLSEQPTVIQTAVTLIIVVVLVGIMLNVLSICTFVQRETQEVGCGLYLLVSSIVGLLAVIILICKMVILLTGQRSDVSCFLVEFLLRWFPKSCEWLNAGVAVERTIAVKLQIQYSRVKSKVFAKWVTPTILIFIGLISMPELFFREVVPDKFDERAWCVLTLNNERPGFLALYSALNILSFMIPLVVNLTSSVIIIRGTVQSKQKTNKKQQLNINKNKKMTQRIYFTDIKNQIVQHKHILITPILLSILSLPQVILNFIFVCTRLDQRSIPSLIAYLVVFLPTMAIPFAFIWPSIIYRTALLTSLKKIVPKYVLNLRSCRK